MTDYAQLYEERKTRVETAIANQEPDRVPDTLQVGTYPLHKAGTVSYTHLDVYKRQLFEKVHFMMGMEDAMISLYEEPEAMHDFIDFLADWEIELAKEYIKYVHPDCLFHHDDWGTQKSLFMSRDMFDEFLLEPYKKIYGFWKANGVEVIVHHSDSYVADLIPSMIEMGVDVHQGTLDTNRIPEQIRNYGGKLSFMGGLNNGKYDKPDWTRDEIRTGLAGLLEETKGMKYLIPALTMGEPGAIFPGVYDCVDELLRDEFDAKYF